MFYLEWSIIKYQYYSIQIIYNMLPLTSRPTLIKLINPSQIIILTSTQLIFTYIAFIEEYL